MLERITLNSYDQEVLDPSGKIRQFLRMSDRDFYNDPNPLFADCDKRFIRYLQIVEAYKCQNPSSRYWNYNFEMSHKYGPQGGSIPLLRQEEYYQRSHELSLRSVDTQDLALGVEYCRHLLGEVVARVGYPQLADPSVWRTAGGVPSGEHKRSFNAETLGFTGNWQHSLPIYPGVRRMRGKDRVINVAPCSSVRYIERMLGGVRKWLVDNLPYFSAWRNPREGLIGSLREGLNRHYVSIETDYHSMDEHFSWTVVRDVILPLYEVLLPGGDFLHLAQYAYEAFNETDIYLGDYLLRGSFNLLSGVPHTQDFETLYSWVLTTTIKLRNPDFRKAVRFECYIGDDSIILVDANSLSKVSSWFNDFTRVTQAAGLEYSTEKCVLGCSQYNFCRKIYTNKVYNSHYNNYDDGMYPTTLALLSLFRPERSRSDEDNVYALFSILDNCVGSPDYIELVRFVFKSIDLTRASNVLENIQANSSTYVDVHDWWYRVYGDTFALSKSPTFRLVKDLKII